MLHEPFFFSTNRTFYISKFNFKRIGTFLANLSTCASHRFMHLGNYYWVLQASLPAKQFTDHRPQKFKVPRYRCTGWKTVFLIRCLLTHEHFLG